MRGISRIRTPAISATIGCKWAMLKVMVPPMICGVGVAVSASAELRQPIEQQQDDRGAGKRQQQPAERVTAARFPDGAPFFVLDLTPPGVLGALDHEPRLGGGALIARVGRRGQGSLAIPARADYRR